jgi:hypothetical protein
VVDLRVDTAELHAAARQLRAVAEIAGQAGESRRVEALVPAIGLDQPTAAVDEFLHRWVYGVRCLGSQAEHLGRELLTCAVAYECAEAALTRAAGGSAPAPIAAGWAPIPEPQRVSVVWRAPTSSSMPVQLAHATRVEELIPGDPVQVAVLGRALHSFADAAVEARLELGRIQLTGPVLRRRS